MYTMFRRTAALWALTLTLFSVYLCVHTTGGSLFKPKIHPGQLRKLILMTWLRQTHDFLPAASEGIQCIGRWEFSTGGRAREAGFPGSRIRFTIHNSTSVFIDLDSIPDDDLPASILVSVGEREWLFKDNGYSILQISHGFSPNTTYEITLTLLESALTRPGIIRFNGVWLSRGGIVGPGTAFPSNTRPTMTADKQQAQRENRHSREPASIIEILAPEDTLSLNTVTLMTKDQDHIRTYPTILEHNDFFNSTVILLPVSRAIHLTTKHRTYNNAQDITIQDLYFRTGPPNTHLFRRPWSWSTSKTKPTILVLSIGLSDFRDFFTATTNQTQPLGRNTLENFTETFVTAYLSLVQTIRRTTWHTHTADQDTTFAYNSAPSDLPILLMLPLLPPSHKFNPSLTTAMHNALQRVITRLRTVEGDTSIRLIDTSGWLDDDDFDPITNTAAVITERKQEHKCNNSDDEIPTPNAKGHQKIAYFLSLHLCPHLAENPTSCPFDIHDAYRGNLYVPDEVAVGRVIEEKKIERMKKLIGGSGGDNDNNNDNNPNYDSVVENQNSDSTSKLGDLLSNGNA